MAACRNYLSKLFTRFIPVRHTVRHSVRQRGTSVKIDSAPVRHTVRHTVRHRGTTMKITITVRHTVRHRGTNIKLINSWVTRLTNS